MESSKDPFCKLRGGKNSDRISMENHSFLFLEVKPSPLKTEENIRIFVTYLPPFTLLTNKTKIKMVMKLYLHRSIYYNISPHPHSIRHQKKSHPPNLCQVLQSVSEFSPFQMPFLL